MIVFRDLFFCILIVCAAPSSAQTSLLGHFVEYCEQAFVAGEKPDVSDLKRSGLQELEGRTSFDLTNGYTLAVSNGDISVPSCGVMLTFPYKFIGNIQDEIDQVEQWLIEKTSKKVLFEKKSWVEGKLKVFIFQYRPREVRSGCPMLFFANDPDGISSELMLAIGNSEDFSCGESLGS